MTSKNTPPGNYELVTQQSFAEVAIDKGLTRRLKLEEQGVPTFVAEWLVARELHRIPDATPLMLDAAISQFVTEHLPRKEQKEVLRNRLFNGEVLSILDNFRVSVDLRRQRRRVEIPSLDERGEVAADVLHQFEGLLAGGLWGAGQLVYEPPPTPRDKGAVWLRAFNPLQAADIELDYYCEQRSLFKTNEWAALMVSSMGYNPDVYSSPHLRTVLLTRLLPLVQRRLNLIELAPKGTGKSFVFSNLSRHTRLISGGKVSPAVLFYNNSTNSPGLLTRFDAVVFDEAQTIRFDNPGEVVGVLKDFMESGRFTRGSQSAAADCSVVFLGNIDIGADGRPVRSVHFELLPDFLRETAFIDRIHGFLPGWEIPKIRTDSPASSIALKADYFSEVLHRLREDSSFDSFVEAHTHLSGPGSDKMRNSKAIKKLCAAYLKLFFPDKNVTPQEYKDYCLGPAIELRQRVCDQLYLMDREFEETDLDGHFE